MSGFQQTVNITTALGVPGEQFDDGPLRAQDFELVSANANYNIVGATIFTITSQGVAQAGNGGTLGLAGLLVNPKAYASFGMPSGGPLAATMQLANYTQGELATMGSFVAAMDNIPNIGDLVTYDPVTGQISSIAPTAKFTASIATSTGVDTLTVTAIPTGYLAIGSLISGTGIPVGTSITALGTGVGGIGTYTLSSSGLTVSSEAMTAPNTPTPTTSYTASIATTVLTVTAVGSGVPAIGQTVNGTGVAAGTVITARISVLADGTGTYTVNNSQTVTSTTMTDDAHVICPKTIVDRYTLTTPGLAVIKLTN